MDWTDVPRKADKVALVGMNPRTKDEAPFNDPSYEIWTLNEHSMADEFRVDRLFQLHPRHDFMRQNNASNPNHPLYLLNQSGVCIFCKGAGVLLVNGETRKCLACKEGTYVPPESRSRILVYMQKDYPDIPNCVKLPFDEMVSKFGWKGLPYFTSTFSYMLVLAMLMGYKEIRIYGFSMEAQTEYFHQRVNAEYWIGWGRALGFDIEAPRSGLLEGELYAYSTPLQAFRQQMEMRKHHLQAQYQNALQASNVTLGHLQALEPLKDQHPKEYQDAVDAHYKARYFMASLNGMVKEMDNLVGLYDASVIDAPTDDSIDPNRPSVMDKLALTYQNGITQ